MRVGRNHEIKLCADCKHHSDGICTRKELSNYCAETVDKIKPVLFQRNSYWLTDCGPAGHNWEAK